MTQSTVGTRPPATDARQVHTFANGDRMPLIGLGTWKSEPGDVYGGDFWVVEGTPWTRQTIWDEPAST